MGPGLLTALSALSALTALSALSLFAPVVVAPAEPGEIAIDAFFDDWSGRPYALLGTVAQGKRDGSADLGGQVQVAFDASRLYLAAQVVDDKWQPGGAGEGDRLYFVFRPDDGPPRRVQIVLNTLEVRPPQVLVDDKPCPGCSTAGTTRVDGWAVEVSIPLVQLPLHTAGTVRSAALVHDCDADAKTADGVVASAPVDGALLPTKKNLRLDGLAALDEGRQIYRSDRKPLGLPQRTLHADIHGDPFPEEVLITDDDIVLIGKDLPERAAYLYFTHGWRSGAEVERAWFEDLDGEPGPELLVEHAEWSVPGEVRVRIVEVFGLHDGFLKRRFAHKVGVEFSGKGKAAAPFEVLRARDGKAQRLQVGVAALDGLERRHYYQSDPDDFPAGPVPMPWDHQKPLVFRLRGEQWSR